MKSPFSPLLAWDEIHVWVHECSTGRALQGKFM